MPDETLSDQRFPTSNTNLAACIGALRIAIKNPDPVWVVVEPENNNKRIVTFFFELGNETEKSAHVDWAWRNREKFERENPKHPLVAMRRGLEALEWCTKVWYGNITPAMRAGPWKYATDDTQLAACIKASGQELHSFADKQFRFGADPKAILDRYENFRKGGHPVCDMRRAMEVRGLLIDLVKRAPKILHYLNGDPGAGGKEGYIAEGNTDERLKTFFDLLYE